MERKTFEFLLRYLSEKNIKEVSPGKPEIGLEKQLQLTLWFLGNQEPYRTISDRFNVSLSTAWVAVNKICLMLNNNRADFISLPTNAKALENINAWNDVSGFPNIYGAIDGTFIEISAPSEHQESYVCRKKYHAIIMQGVCAYDMKFIDVDIGFPGSMHDARVFRCSDLYRHIVENYNGMLPNDSHLIGDSAYPNKNYLITPFKNFGNLSQRQKLFNRKLSSSRVKIEQAFGLLFGRFRRLKKMYLKRTDKIPLYVLAACILHNLCIIQKDEIDEIETYFEEPEEEPVDEYNTARDRHLSASAEAILATQKRNNIMNSL